MAVLTPDTRGEKVGLPADIVVRGHGFEMATLEDRKQWDLCCDSGVVGWTDSDTADLDKSGAEAQIAHVVGRIAAEVEQVAELDTWDIGCQDAVLHFHSKDHTLHLEVDAPVAGLDNTLDADSAAGLQS